MYSRQELFEQAYSSRDMLTYCVFVFKGVNVCVYVGEGLRCSFATPNPFVLANKICLNQGIC